MTDHFVHGTCVETDGAGVLVLGASGSGKSDLALRLIDGGWRLVADDQVVLTVRAGVLVAAAPETTRGRLEVRGVGILAVPTTRSTPVGLVVELVAPEDVPRLPEAGTREYLGVRVRAMTLAPFEVSAAAKVRIAVRARDHKFTGGLPMSGMTTP